MRAKVLQDIQTDFNDLALEARHSRNAGISGQLSGLFASGQHKDVKAAAEAAQVALRALEASADPAEACRGCTEIVDAVVLSCSRTRKLCTQALAIAQKLVINDLLSAASCQRIVATLRHISASKAHDDEAVKLKLLQTCLTLLQVKSGIADPETAQQVLATCFRLLSNKNAATIVNTASAIVRQAIALVFERASARGSDAAGSAASPSAAPHPYILQFQAPAERTPPASPLTSAAQHSPSGEPAQAEGHAGRTDAAATPRLQQGAALLVLKELCLMCRGHGSEALDCKPLSVAFVLDIICEIVRTNVALFRERGPYLDALREDVCGALLFVLKAQLEVETELVKVHTLQSVLQGVAAVVTQYGYLLATKTELFLQKLLHGVNAPTHFAQQVLCMNAIRAICMSPSTVHFLYTTYDMKLDHQLRSVALMLQTACDFVIAFTAKVTAPGRGDEESLALLATLWSQKMANRQLNFESELASHVSTGHGGLYIVLLAIDAVAVLLHSIAHIADRLQPAASKDSPLAKAAPIAPLGTPEISESPEVAPALSPRESAECSHLSGPFQTPRTTVRRSHDAGASTGGGPAADTAAARSRQARRVQESLAAQEHIWAALAPVTEETCRLLLETVWPSALEALTEVLKAVGGEALAVHILRALQSLATVAGVLGMTGAMHATLAATCSFTVDGAPAPPQASARGGREATSPTRQDSQSGIEDAVVPAAPPPPPRPRAEGTVLTPRNVQAFRTVFNITHALFERLGPRGWHLVLSALAVLDEVLCSPATTTLQRAATPGDPEKNSDLSVLETATAQLFATTAYASDATVDTVMQTLLNLSEKGGVYVQTGAPRCFALDHMVEVVVCNPARSGRLFEMLRERVCAMSLAPDSAHRAAAVSTLQRAAMLLLEGQQSGIPGQSASEAEVDAGTEEPLECRVLSAVGTVFRERGAATDVRFGCLEILHHILQSHGEALSHAWPQVLALLEEVATGATSARLVRVGHECMELTLTEFLPHLRQEQLRRALHVEACFVLQSVDVNTCYSASLNLWRAADMIGCALQRISTSGARTVSGGEGAATKVPSQQQKGLLYSASSFLSSFASRSLDAPGEGAAHKAAQKTADNTAAGASPTNSEGHDTAESGALAQLAAALTLARGKDLLLFVMESAQRIALDPRPEVRTSGIKLLFDIMTRHSAALAGDEGRVWDMAFPLLMEVAKNVQLSNEAHAQSARGAAPKAANHALAVHHSRDSHIKQWLETLEKALRGWTAYLKAMLTQVMHLPCFEDDWATLMTVLHGLMTMDNLPDDAGSRKVATACTTFFSSVVAPHAAAPACPPFLWPSAWSVLFDCSRALAAHDTSCHASVRVRFVHTLAQMYGACRGRFDGAAYRKLLDVFAAFVDAPVSRTEAWPPYFIPAVQAAVLAALPNALPPPSAADWPAVVDFLSAQLQPRQHDAADGVARGAASSEPLVRRIWVREVSEKLLELFRHSMPVAVRAAAFQPLLDAYRPGVALRWAQPEAADVARALSGHLCALVDMGLPAVHIAAVHKGSAGIGEGVWTSLADVLSVSLMPPADTPQLCPVASASAAQDAQAEERVLDCLCNTVVVSCGPAKLAAKQRLLSILEDGCAAPQRANLAAEHQLSHTSLRKLHELCGRALPQQHEGHTGLSRDAHLEVVSICLPVFLARCAVILESHCARREPGVPPVPSAPHTPGHVSPPLAEASRGTATPAAASGDAHVPQHAEQATPAHLGDLGDDTDLTGAARPSPRAASESGSADEATQGFDTAGAQASEASLAPASAELALAALQALLQLQLQPEVIDECLPERRRLDPLVRCLRSGQSRHERGIERTEQAHLLLMHACVLRCTAARHVAVQEAAMDILTRVGIMLGLHRTQ